MLIQWSRSLPQRMGSHFPKLGLRLAFASSVSVVVFPLNVTWPTPQGQWQLWKLRYRLQKLGEGHQQQLTSIICCLKPEKCAISASANYLLTFFFSLAAVCSLHCSDFSFYSSFTIIFYVACPTCNITRVKNKSERHENDLHISSTVADTDEYLLQNFERDKI